MPPSPLDSWFADFRRDGDAPALARVFDATAPELLRVARHLATDAHAAEDLVQATFLKAIEHRDRYDPCLPVLPWLLGILANAARHERRQQRRPTPPALAAVADSPVDVAAHGEAKARLHAALRGLPEPYRQVLLLQVEHGLDSGAIAEITGRKASTVRTQIARGMDLLRAALPIGAAVVVASTTAVAAADGLAAVRAVVLQRANEVVAGAGGAAGVVSGGLLMKKVLVVAAALLCLAAGAWLAIEPDARAPLAPTAAGAATAIAERGTAPGAGFAPSVAAADARRSPSTADERAVVRVMVRTADGAAAAQVGVYLAGDSLRPLGREAATDAVGVVVFDDLVPGTMVVKPDRGPAVPIDVVAGTNEIEVRLPVGVDVVGRVSDARGKAAIPHATIHTLSREHHDRAQRLGQADAEGMFTLRAVPPGTHLFARAPGWQPGDARSESVDALAKSPQRVDLRVGARAFALRGRVTRTDGAPAAFAQVAIAVDEDAHKHVEGLRQRPSGRQRQRDVEAFLLRADAHGDFATDEVPEGEALVVARAASGEAPGIAIVPVQVVAGADNRCEVVLQPGATLFGTLRDENGEPMPGLPVLAEWMGTEAISFEGAFGQVLSCVEATTDARGDYRLGGLLPGEHDVYARASLRADLRHDAPDAQNNVVTLLAGEQRRLDLALPRRGDLRLRLLGPTGEPLVGWGVWACEERTPTPRMQQLEAQRTDAEGRVRIASQLRDRVLCVSVFAPRAAAAGDRRIDRYASRQWTDVTVHDDERVLQLMTSELPTGSLSARIVDSRQAPYALKLARLWREGWFESRRLDAPDGVVVAEALPAGRYWLEASGNGSPLLGPFEVVAAARRDAGVLVVPEPGGLRVAVKTADGGHVRDARAELRRRHVSGQSQGWSLDRRDGILELSGKPPGGYRLVVHASDFAPAAREVELRAGERNDIEVVLPHGFAQPFTVAVGNQTTPAQRGGWLVDCDVYDAEGAHVGSVQPTALPFTLQLTRGTWMVRWNTPDGPRTSTKFTLAGDQPLPPIVLRPD